MCFRPGKVVKKNICTNPDCKKINRPAATECAHCGQKLDPPGQTQKREVACPKCNKMNPLPLSVDALIADIMGNAQGKAILEKHCSVMTNDPQFKMAMRMTLKEVKPMSRGKVTQAMIDLVAQDLAQLPAKKECRFCGETLP